ncbi:hypothetical protein C2G38_2179762 [Gigaspora rosea]|uniref:Uncharacterized protein n=1 Tax=Gigaspora rosea TaxID=44941 RepID=A0A397VCQ7_9GLOM|nr:hypothetical protein C2G38_2179762 [Gigaspora rosea]
MKVTKCSINSKKFKKCGHKKRKVITNKKIDDEFYSALLLIFSRIKNKPILLPNDNNRPDDNSNTQTTSTTNTPLPRPTTTKPDFDFPKRPKDLPTLEESATNSITTTIPPSTTSTKTTDVPSKTISELPEPTSDSNVSCPICKLEFTQIKIEEHLKDHIKNPLSEDLI